MIGFSDLKRLAENNSICVECCELPKGVGSIYTHLAGCPVVICIDSMLREPERTVEFAVCLGYYFTQKECGADMTIEEKREMAEDWAYSRLMPVELITEAFSAGAADLAGIASYMGLPVDYVRQAACHYAKKLGSYALFGPFCVFFEPLSVFKKF